jgi:hypothetical protein
MASSAKRSGVARYLTTRVRYAYEVDVSIRTLNASELKEMRGVVWKPQCPVALSDLRRVEMNAYRFDGSTYRGALVVHKDVSKQVGRIFAKLFEEQFPIESLIPIEAFDGDDDRSTLANNSSGFNCRPVTGGRKFSEHSYGRAIDINPLQNPYVRSDGTVLDPAAEAFVDRKAVAKRPGVISANGLVVATFRSEGFAWGGNFKRTKDYQHFSTTGR